jgi:arylamine N-acetyltransferase
MHNYTEEQLARYFERIELEYSQDARRQVSEDPLGFLTTLQRHHLARVPFESLSLHYSRHRLLSLDPEDLFKKIVDNGRGGYCMEVNTLFATVLRSLGFMLISVGGRVRVAGGRGGW